MAQTCVGLEQLVNQENTPCSFIQSHELLIVAHSLTNAASLFPLIFRRIRKLGSALFLVNRHLGFATVLQVIFPKAGSGGSKIQQSQVVPNGSQ